MDLPSLVSHSRSISPVNPIFRASCRIAAENCSATMIVSTSLQGTRMLTRPTVESGGCLSLVNPIQTPLASSESRTVANSIWLSSTPRISVCGLSCGRRNIFTPCKLAHVRRTTTAMLAFLSICIDDDLERLGARRPRKRVVSVQDAVELEVVGDQDLGVEFARLHHLEQHGQRHRVDQPR